MKFTSIFYAGTLAVAAIAAPLADLEREQFGSVIPRTHLSPEIAKRVGGRSKPPRDAGKIERIRSSRYTGDPEIRQDYAARRRDAPQYPRGEWKPWRDSTPEPGRDGTVLRSKEGGEPYFDHYYSEESQPWTADVWRTAEELYPQYRGYGFKMRHGDDQRLYTLATPKIDTPSWAKGTDREEEPPQSYYYPEGAFTVGRVPNEESKFQSYMLRAASDRYPDAEHYFHDNRKDKSNRVTIVRGPRAADSNGAYDYDPRWGIPRVPDSDVENYLYPAQRPQPPYAESQPRPPPAGFKHFYEYDANIQTIAPDYATSSSSRRRRHRSRDTEAITERDIIDTIESSQSSANDTSRADQVAQIEGYLWAFQEARDNATDLLQPFLVNLLNGTNSYLGEAMAWGLYTMVHPDISLVGPFMGPLSSFGSVGMGNTTSNSTGNATNDEIWNEWGNAINSFYTDLWQNATAVVNETGLLADLELFEGYLLPEDRTLLPDSERVIDEHALDGFYDFLASMYAYNGYIFSANETADGMADFKLYPEDFEDDSGANGTAVSNATIAKRSVNLARLW